MRMATTTNWLVGAFLAIVGICITSVFDESKLAKPWQKILIALTTFCISLIFVISTARAIEVLYMLPICVASHAILLIDCVSRRIPNKITLPLGVVQTVGCLVGSILGKSVTPLLSILFSVAVLASFIILNFASKNQFGMGDVKLSYSLALGVGSVSLSLVFWCFALAFLVAGIFASLLLLTRRANLKTNFAFGPFLIVATWVSIFFYGVSLN